MNKKILYVIFMLIVIFAVIGGFMVVKNKNAEPPKNAAPTEQDKSSASVDVNFTTNGFSTGTVTIKTGVTVNIKNLSSSDIEITSANGNFKIERDKVYPFTLSSVGQYTYTEKKSNQKLLIIAQ